MVRLVLALSAFLTFGACLAQTVLKPGDVVTVTCVEDPKISGEYTLTDTGLILLQYIGAVEVKGLTEAAAAAKISKELISQQILRAATITLTLRRRNELPITYGGAVQRGGEMPYRPGIHLSDVLKIAAPSLAADLTAVRITKLDGEVLAINWTAGKDDPLLDAGDRVFIPLKLGGTDIIVFGAVVTPGSVDYKTGMTVSQAIAAAGGFRSDAEKSRVTVRLRAGGSSLVDLSQPGSDITLSPGDQVTVPVRASREYVYVRGAIAKPGLIAYTPGLTVLRAVNEANPVEGARLDRVKIIRKAADDKSTTTTVDILKISRGVTPDEPLFAGDIVDIPYPAKSYDVQDTVRVLSLALFLYFLFRR